MKALLLLLVAGQWLSPRVQDTADRVLRAFRAHDEAELEKLAALDDLDAWLVADALLARTKDGAGEPLDAALDFARRAVKWPENAALERTVLRWKALTPEERGREEAFRADLTPLASRQKTDQETFLRLHAKALESRSRAPEGILTVSSHQPLAETLVQIGRREEAVQAWREMAAGALRLDWPHLEAMARFRAAEMLLRIGRFGEAEEHLREAIRRLAPTRDRLLPAVCRSRLAEAARMRNDYDGALALLDEVLKAHQLSKDAARQAHTLCQIGDVQLARGEYSRALDTFEQGLAALAGRNNPKESAQLHRMIGHVHQLLERHDRALEMLDVALPEARAARDRDLAAAILHGRSKTLAALHRPADARASAEEGLREAQAIGRVELQALSLAQLGSLLLDEREPLRAAERYGQALALAEKHGFRALAAHYRCGWGRAVADERPAEGLAKLREGQRELERLGNLQDAALALAWIAGVEERLGQAAAALESATRALELRLRGLGGLGETDASGLPAVLHDVAGTGGRATLRLMDSKGADPDAMLGAAFRLMESGRALLLAEGLSRRAELLETQVPPALRDAHREARERIGAARRALESPTPEARAQELARDLDAAYRELEKVNGRIEREARRVALVAFPRPVEAARFQESLPDRSAAVLYHVDAAAALALVVTKRSLRLVKLPATAEDLGARVEGWLEFVAAGQDDAERARDLHRLLLEPVEALLGDEARLLIAPDGNLAFLPFEALRRANGERVLERWEVAYLPSATVHAVLCARAEGLPRGEGIVALGDPAYPEDAGARTELALRSSTRLARLPATGEEAKAVAALFPEPRRRVLLGGRASVQDLREALGAFTGRLAAVHLACHGHLDTARPRLTGLALAGGELLTLDDVYRLRVEADLAVLSACETARGRIASGEGVLGLVRGFFHAGCPRVVVSDWRVPDASTGALMLAFYRQMAEHGLAPAAALRAAKLEFLRAGGARAHPREWAAFVLWGLPD
jgi:CHAT domain-containing protein